MTSYVAPVGAMEGRRRPLASGHVLVRLEDLLIVTWPVHEATLRARLPRGLEPWLVDGHALVSAVFFRNRDLRPAMLEFPRFTCVQLNLRSYLADPQTGRPGSVYFHGFLPNGRLIARVSSLLTRVPMGHVAFELEVEHASERISRWEARSADDRIRVRAREDEQAMPSDEQLDLLTNVHTGYVASPAGELRCWSIWHKNQTVHTMRIEQAVVHPLSEAGIDVAKVVSALYVRSVDYEVYMPARRV